MDAEQFKSMTGHEPEQDDLERVNCTKAGQPGHFFCGICLKHMKPRFICGCMAPKPAIIWGPDKNGNVVTG